MTGAPCGRVHPTALIGEPPQHRDHRASNDVWATFVGDGALIEAYVVVSAGTFRRTRVGARTWLMCGTHIGHDTIIGSGCEISANVTVCGECEIGDNVKIGAGATLRPRVKVGDGAQVGAGAVVTKDVPAGEVWVGNPARKLPAAATRTPLYEAAIARGSNFTPGSTSTAAAAPKRLECFGPYAGDCCGRGPCPHGL